MSKEKKWICTGMPHDHIFDGPSEDGYCPYEPYGHGMLFQGIPEEPPKSEEEPEPWQRPGPVRPGKGREGGQPVEIGLCVILMDASSSMTDPAFEGNPLTRMHLVASSAAAGIFDLERMQNNPNAYVAAFRFDDRVERMFVDTVANLIKRYEGNVKKFSEYIYGELFKMQRGTDINKALDVAHSFIEKFLNHQLNDFTARNYTPMYQRIMKYQSADSVSIPNIRVLIYTDGMQFDAHEDRKLLPNPFIKRKLSGLNHDIVIGAFFGRSSDEGCRELKSLLSNCPIHDEPQFFLFDSPVKIGNLKYLFRMASGASGFCPNCLDQQLNR